MPIISTRLACGLVIAALATLGNAISIRGIHAGANPETGERPFRQEFSTFKNSGAAFDLYIQALLKLQQRDQRDPISFFGVAGNLSGIRIKGGRLLISIKESMAFPFYHGMESMVRIEQGTVHTTVPCSPSGIDLMWRCLRFATRCHRW